jgi:hypothetical protein
MDQTRKAQFQVGENEIIQTIKDSVKTEAISIDGREFLTRPIFDPPRPALASALTTHTLQSVVDYIVNDGKIDQVVPKPTEQPLLRGLAVHVVSEHQVQVISNIVDRFRQREVYINAECVQIIGQTFRFGQFYPLENFIIALRSLFADSEHVSDLIRVLGRVDDSVVKQFEDDGISQTVTATTGVATKRDVTVPTVVTLTPFRTFREIDQPQAEFFLRLQSGRSEGEPPLAALFETDGGKWKLESIERIKAFLAEKITEVPIIA